MEKSIVASLILPMGISMLIHQAKELELEQRRAAAVAAKAEKDALNGVVTLDEAEVWEGYESGYVYIYIHIYIYLYIQLYIYMR